MGLFSFGKKDDAPSGRDAYSDFLPRLASGERVGAANPPHASARRRRCDAARPYACRKSSVRAAASSARSRWCVAAVIVLPMVLDSHPKPVTDDIAIDIPNRPAREACQSRGQTRRPASRPTTRRQTRHSPHPALRRQPQPGKASPAPRSNRARRRTQRRPRPSRRRNRRRRPSRPSTAPAAPAAPAKPAAKPPVTHNAATAPAPAAQAPERRRHEHGRQRGRELRHAGLAAGQPFRRAARRVRERRQRAATGSPS